METPDVIGPQMAQDAAFSAGAVVQSGEALNLNLENPEPVATPAPSGRLNILNATLDAHSKNAAVLSESVEKTGKNLSEIRDSLGLSHPGEDPEHVLRDKDTLAKISREKAALEQQRDKLIEQERSQSLQRSIDSLFKQFGRLTPKDFESILSSGKTAGNESIRIGSNELSPELAQLLARAFKEGLKFLPDILQNLPEITETLKSLSTETTVETTKAAESKPIEAVTDKAHPEQPQEATAQPETTAKPGLNVEGVNPSGSFTVQSDQPINIGADIGVGGAQSS